MSRETLLLQISVVVYLIFISLEIYVGHKNHKKLYGLKDSMVSLWMGIAGGALDFAMQVVTFGVLNWCNSHALFVPDLLNHSLVFAWLLVFIAQDFFFYWLHRAEHYSRFLWAVHSNHHSSQYYNFTVALRSSVLQPLYRFVFYIPIAFLGFDGLTIMFMYAVNQFYQFFLHTETIGKLGYFEKLIFVTPSHHRVHHSSNVQYLDKNMGQVLIIWDKLFGTFQKEEDTIKPVFGLTKNLGTFHPLRAVFGEWQRLLSDLRKTNSWKNRLKYIFYPPGWSHDGSSKTSAQMREEAKRRV